MKKLSILVLLIGILSIPLFATSAKETGSGLSLQTGPVTIGIWGNVDTPIDNDDPNGVQLYRDIVFGDADYAYTILFYPPGASGADQPIDLDIAAGVGPDVYYDYMGRISKYANARYAVALDNYLSQAVFDNYIPSFLDLMKKDGHQYGLPADAWISTMIVNLDLLEKVGMSYIADRGSWTIDEFLEASRRVKALGPDYYGYRLFAATTGGDYWHLGFIPSFGANLYENGKIAINSPEGIAALKFYKAYQDEGLSPPGAASATFQDFMALYNTGKLLATANSPASLGPDGMVPGDNAFKGGTADHPFKSIALPFPTAEGVDKTPIALGPDGVMLFRKPYGVSNEQLNAVQRLAGSVYQAWRRDNQFRWVSFASLANNPTAAPHWIAGNKILVNNGVWDMGVGLPEYGAVRALVPPMFQAIYTGELTVEQAVARFEVDGNKILEGR